jgi:hypothetical protein
VPDAHSSGLFGKAPRRPALAQLSHDIRSIEVTRSIVTSGSDQAPDGHEITWLAAQHKRRGFARPARTLAFDVCRAEPLVTPDQKTIGWLVGKAGFEPAGGYFAAYLFRD